MSRVTEKELVLPALYCIKKYSNVNTTKLIKLLTEFFSPSGEDAEILAGRNDTKFSQKVRNLVGSHYNTNTMSTYTYRGSDGCFHLTDIGKVFLDRNIDNITTIMNSTSDYFHKWECARLVSRYNNQIFIYDENDVISEGRAETKTSNRRTRSRILRSAAIKKYSDTNGHIKCCVCGFDFIDFYGEIGKGYIDIHHERPIFQLSNDGNTEFLKDALKNVKPVCPNCHRMLHRNRKHTLTIEELKNIISKISP